MAPEPHDIGCRYVFNASAHNYDKYDSSARPPLCTLSEVLLLAVADTMYPIHRHVVESKSELIAAKLRNNDYFRVFFAGTLYKLLHLQVPLPGQFEHVVLDLYGCLCQRCTHRDESVRRAVDQIKDYLLLRE